MSEQTLLEVRLLDDKPSPERYPFLKYFEVSHSWPMSGHVEKHSLLLPENVLNFKEGDEESVNRLLGWVLYWSLRLWGENIPSPLINAKDEEVESEHFPFTLNLITQFNRRQTSNPGLVEGFEVRALTPHGWSKSKALIGWDILEVKQIKDKAHSEMSSLFAEHNLKSWD